MFKTKKDVDRHVRSSLARLRTDNEVSIIIGISANNHRLDFDRLAINWRCADLIDDQMDFDDAMMDELDAEIPFGKCLIDLRNVC